jgi:pilus assembly protein CpaF
VADLEHQHKASESTMIGLALRNRLDDRKAFQRLKAVLERRIIEAVDLSRAADLSEGELHDQVKALASHVCDSDSIGLPDELREGMVREILDDIYGFGPLQPMLDDPDITEVVVNGPNNVCIERDGVLRETDIRFADNEHLGQLIQRLVRRAGAQINERSPVVETRLPDGSLLTAIIPPLALRGPMLSIRRSMSMRLDDLLGRGALTREMADFLSAAVQGRLGILISGPAGAGRTTLLDCLGQLVPERERIITIERTAALAFERSNVVSLEVNSTPSTRQRGVAQELVKTGLRMRPDRFVVDEPRDEEAFELLQAMSNGQAGSLVAMSANNVGDALERLELSILRSVEPPPSGIRHQIASAFQILVQVARKPSGERQVVRVAELCGYSDGSYAIEDIFVYRAAGTDDEGRSLGTFYSTGYEPVSLPHLAGLGHALDSDLFTPRELSTAQVAPAPTRN